MMPRPGGTDSPAAPGVGDQQHRSQWWLTAQTPAFIDAQQRLRSAGNARHLVGGREIGNPGAAAALVPRRVHPVDLHRGEQRPQTAVADEPLDGPGPTFSPNSATFSRPGTRRSRGAPAVAVPTGRSPDPCRCAAPGGRCPARPRCRPVRPTADRPRRGAAPNPAPGSSAAESGEWNP